MQLGYSTWGMPTVPIDHAIRHIAALGFDGIEIAVIPGFTTELSTLDSAERLRIKQLLRTHSLALPAIHANASFLEHDPDLHAANMARLRGGIDLAVDLAIGDRLPVVATTPGGQPEQWEEHKNLLVERASELAAYAASRGVTITLEGHIGAIVETPAQVLEVLALIDSPFFKANFDISHFDILGMLIEETVAALAPHSAHAHVKDQRGRFPDFEFLIPGEGTFDYVAYLRAMHAHGYTRFVNAEVSFMVQRRPDYDPMAAAEQCYTVLAHAFAAAGIERD